LLDSLLQERNKMAPVPPSKEQKKEEQQEWLDNSQYSRNGILRYERIFGKTFVSVGGEYTTRLFTEKLNLWNNMKVLDVGAGIGGSAFYMARRYGLNVHGVDLSTNMTGIAQQYRREMEPEVTHRTQFNVEDATSMAYPSNFYDVVYSRDTLIHIEDKLSLFKKFYGTLKAGGKIMISDYCVGEKEHTPRFKEYLAQRDYRLTTIKNYGAMLEQAGFKNVEAVNVTPLMLEMLEKELEYFLTIKDSFIKEFSQKDFDDIKEGWEIKLQRFCKDGDQVWGLFTGEKA